MVEAASIANGNRKVLVVAAVALSMSGSSAFAQNCNTVQNATPTTITNIGQFAIPTVAAASAISGAIGNVSTAFLAQQGSAFVSAPGNAAPDQPGGGVWARAVGGHVDINSTSNSTVVTTPVAGGAPVNTSTTSCLNRLSSDFVGVQAGTDIARLNWNGWNVHLGTTAGYLSSKSNDSFGFDNRIEVPFFGTYLVATYGRFFADLMVREDFYNINLNNPAFTFFNQPVSAHGYSVSTSAGYNFDLGQGWFVEPSGGFTYSKTSVDNFNAAGAPNLGIPALIQTNNIESEIGRLSLRVGKVIETPTMIWQPFASASVFHEFAGDVITNASSLPNSAALGGVPVNLVQSTSTSRIGTYGQYSLGIAGQVIGTGWLGFARVDYRDGDNINGWTGNAGIRYQFTPEMIASVMPVKAKAPSLPYIAATDWTGFFLGGFAGVAGGRTDIGFVGAPVSVAGERPWVAGGLGGIEAGYNYQFAGNWVVGVEGDIAAANVHGGRTAGADDGLPADVFSPAFFTIQDRTNWMATLTGKLGYAWRRTLFYVKGGAAFEDSSTSVACDFGPTGVLLAFNCRNQAGAVTAGFSTPTYTRIGWTLGFGSSFDLGHNWSARAEYDYLSFGRHTALASDGTTFLTDKSNISQVKIGLDYKFGGSALVAKY